MSDVGRRFIVAARRVPAFAGDLQRWEGRKSLPLDGGGQVGVVAWSAAVAFRQGNGSRREYHLHPRATFCGELPGENAGTSGAGSRLGRHSIGRRGPIPSRERGL